MDQFRGSISKEKRGSDDSRKAVHATWGIVAVLSVLVLIVATAVVAAQPPTPFHIYGWVTDSTGQPLDNPNVTVRNLDTPESYTVKINAGYSYYQVITSSYNVSAGHVLNFTVCDNGNTTGFNHTVMQEGMNNGGLFEQNLSLRKGICGDVDGNEKVDSMDYVTLRAYVVGAPGWTITSEWAADVDCNTKIDSMDYVILRAYIVGAPGWTLNCC